MGKYFTISELCASETARKKGIDNTPSEEIKNHLEELIEKVLDPLREAYGSPIRCSSGYRCPELNKAVGGALYSGHLYGYCADLQVKGNIRQFADFVKQYLDKNNIKYDELLFEKSGRTEWLHFAWKGKGGRQRMKCFSIIK